MYITYYLIVLEQGEFKSQGVVMCQLFPIKSIMC